MLSHRERVHLALSHNKTDRVPMDFAGTQTGILVEPYQNLKHHLGIDSDTRVSNIVLGLAHVDDLVLEHFDIDFRHVLPRVPDTWKLEMLPDDSFYDEWRVRWLRPEGGFYYDMVEHPLAVATLEAFEDYSWPDPLNPGRLDGVRDEVKDLRSNTDYAIEAGLVGLWESAWFLVGFQTWLMACVSNRDFVEAVLDKTLEILIQMHSAYLDETGPYLDMVTLWDDYGTQNATLISPNDWRKLVKPRLAELVGVIRKKTSANIGMHSCGSLISILDDLVEVGIEVINPVQVTARGMQPSELKKRYGRKLSFWGGVDTQNLLPYGSPQDVSQAVQDIISVMGEGGGYILAAVHNIQPGVPAENIIAMYNTGMSTRFVF